MGGSGMARFFLSYGLAFFLLWLLIVLGASDAPTLLVDALRFFWAAAWLLALAVWWLARSFRPRKPRRSATAPRWTPPPKEEDYDRVGGPGHARHHADKMWSND
jgi:hypothetical protein